MFKNNIFKFLLLNFFILTNLFSDDNQRILDQLASPMPEIPLKSALGEKAFNDAVGSGKYKYVGSSKCRLCHREFFIGRKNDPHDSALKSLTNSGYEENSNCLTCHSTGHRVKSGYVNQALTPRLSNVQCEGCHGPGNEHVKIAKAKMRSKEKFLGGGFLAGTDKPQILKKMCTSCHTKRWNKAYHDLDESYNSYKSANPNTMKSR
jgi:hypothetical protein